MHRIKLVNPGLYTIEAKVPNPDRGGRLMYEEVGHIEKVRNPNRAPKSPSTWRAYLGTEEVCHVPTMKEAKCHAFGVLRARSAGCSREAPPGCKLDPDNEPYAPAETNGAVTVHLNPNDTEAQRLAGGLLEKVRGEINGLRARVQRLQQEVAEAQGQLARRVNLYNQLHAAYGHDEPPRERGCDEERAIGGAGDTLSLREAIREILRREGRPLAPKQIADLIKSQLGGCCRAAASPNAVSATIGRCREAEGWEAVRVGKKANNWFLPRKEDK